MAWQPTYVKRVISADIPTSTSPIFVDTDAGRGYVKMPTSSAGPHALVSEWVGTKLAEWFGLPVFDYAVVPVAPIDLDSQSNIEDPVLAFITREESGNPWEGDTKVLKEVENVRDFSWIIVFDTWVGNIDRHSWGLGQNQEKEWRNERNVFLSEDASEGKFKLKAYDHTHCQLSQIVVSPTVNLEAKIEDRRVYGCFAEFKPFLLRDEVSNASRKLREMNDEIARDIVTSVPNEWIKDDMAQDRLTEFIKRRSQIVSNYIEATLFPQGELFQ